jgi:hypothetical protein
MHTRLLSKRESLGMNNLMGSVLDVLFYPEYSDAQFFYLHTQHEPLLNKSLLRDSVWPKNVMEKVSSLALCVDLQLREKREAQSQTLRLQRN